MPPIYRSPALIASICAITHACTASPPPAAIQPGVDSVLTYEAGELGSYTNPVKAEGPFGQREFLRRLVCPNGTPPTFDRAGSYGAGSDGHTLDGYDVVCADDRMRAVVFMDMYHADYRERSQLRPFRVLNELPARTATGCPPRVHTDPDSSARYVFDVLEVETPAEPINAPEGTFDPLQDTFVYFTVSAEGVPELQSIMVGDWLPDSVQANLRTVVAQLRYRPALHRGTCAVRQRVGLYLRPG